eukprot:TRINITY_DN7807_c0_g6_i1.p1 TRINITY_DN7807_c0_g6~~TRINITY_DN7807_c0_g6_i1.p1  ORF type:complete len:242 (+),score=73.05 TRINITY_DN7807_c0_g6_i1:35-760(+)
MELGETLKACKKHPGNILDYYCSEEACKKEICKLCIPEHPKHLLIPNDISSKHGEKKRVYGSKTADLSEVQFKGDLLWSGGTKVFKHEDKDYTYVTDTSATLLPNYFSVQVKVNKLKESAGSLVGISKKKLQKKSGYRLCMDDDDQYALCNFAEGRLFSHCDSWKSYGCSFFEGDTITVTMDKERTLWFAVNEKDCGPAVKNVKGYYYLAITTNYPGNEFEIVSVKAVSYTHLTLPTNREV